MKREDVFGEYTGGAEGLDAKRLEDALQKQATDGKAKRGDHSMHQVEVTPEDMEAYRLKRIKRDDPMAAFLSAAGDGENGGV